MNKKDIVINTIKFKGAERMPMDLGLTDVGTDIYAYYLPGNPDARPKNGTDEWGAVWENIGISNLGQVKEFPLKSWDDFERLKIPDIREPWRYKGLMDIRNSAGDKFLLGNGVSLYERIHFIRGLENAWMDIYDNEKELRKLMDILVDMDIYLIQQYAKAGFNGFIWCDDWGLQDRLMISPLKWREIWKPAYAKVYKAAHDAGMLTFLHSCGYIVDILDDLIEIGLDVIQMDQQENMTLELLSKWFRGKITFWNPVDIQKTMAHGTIEEIKAYARKMVRLLGTPKGGFIAKNYSDWVGAGHSMDAVRAMAEEFADISKNYEELFKTA